MSRLGGQAEGSPPPPLRSMQTLRGLDEAGAPWEAVCFTRSADSRVHLPQISPRRPAQGRCQE